MNNLLPLPVLLPLLGAGLALILGRHPRAQRAVSSSVLLIVVVHSASVQDRAGATLGVILARAGVPEFRVDLGRRRLR